MTKTRTKKTTSNSPAVSHIPQFGDANTSLTGDVDVSAGDAHL